MGTFIVGGGLLIVIGLIVFSLIRRHRQGKSIFCDGVSCNACSAHAICQPGHSPANQPTDEEKTIRFYKRT